MGVMGVLEGIAARIVDRAKEARYAMYKKTEDDIREKCETGHKFNPADLVYAAKARCPCGAGMAYPTGMGPFGFWDCSDILLGKADDLAQHSARLSFICYEIKSEKQPSAQGATTRRKAAA